VARSLLPLDLGRGRPLPRPSGWTEGNYNSPALLLRMAALGFTTGLLQQVESLRVMLTMRDLSLFVLSLVFLGGAASTAISAAAIIASDVLGVSIIYIGAGAFVGLIAAIAGLAGYRCLLDAGVLGPKHVLVSNVVVLIGLLVYVAFVDTLAGFFVISVVGGSQIGAVGAFSRSVVSSLIPQHHQGKLFTFYELSQDGTSWIGVSLRYAPPMPDLMCAL
jgi:MFS-type transporter involved in bile tolerance (Atg22 family)